MVVAFAHPNVAKGFVVVVNTDGTLVFAGPMEVEVYDVPFPDGASCFLHPDDHSKLVEHYRKLAYVESTSSTLQ